MSHHRDRVIPFPRKRRIVRQAVYSSTGLLAKKASHSWTSCASRGTPPRFGHRAIEFLEERKITPKTPPLEYEINYPKYEKRYGVALGLPSV